MKSIRKTKFKRLIFLLLGLFVALFLFRFIYGYQVKNTDNQSYDSHVFNEIIAVSTDTRKNYASKKYQLNEGISNIHVDQKYEKIATINTISNKFDKEEKLLRAQIKDYEGLIQYEHKKGNKGNRALHLTIGIPPENFDSIYKSLIGVGQVQSKQITKTDKTNEYKELNARKESLEKIRASLIDLKRKGGQIEEFIQLENRILDIEQKLQGLGVSLGNFDDENEFCTVKVALFERTEIRISLMHRAKVALEWTITNYLMLVTALAFMSLFAYLFILVAEKIKTKI